MVVAIIPIEKADIRRLKMGTFEIVFKSLVINASDCIKNPGIASQNISADLQ
jgi:hypothetical protein